MGLDSFRNDKEGNGRYNPSNLNIGASEQNHSTKGGKYDEEDVLEVMRQCNSETPGERISRNEYNNWRSNLEFDCPSGSWFQRNGGWNEWLTKAGIEHNSRGTKITFDGIDEMSPSKAYVIGVLIGDGSVITEKGQHKIQLSTADESFKEMYCNRLCEFTNLDRSSITEGTTDNMYYATKVSKELTLEMDKYMSGTWTEWVDELTTEEAIYLISGLYDSEGHYDERVGKCSFTSTSISIKNLFVWCLTEHLLDFTAVSEVRRKSISYHNFSIHEFFREETSNIEYQVILSEEFSERFINSISCSISRKLGKSE
ncbi:MAG: hypothetical protein J07AB43_01590 [Candidatus Nanosalina sp. J07AB43]|jgi:hypothetical protein|nr:MAG: hypothetical protein J07AB43_01590 [Candidatus Nanosalina sp. J07AB43]